MSRFSSNGSPTWTLGRLAASASPSPKPAEASTDTPPMPSRPVDGPEQHGEVADARRPGEHEPLDRHHAEAQHVDERVLGVGLVEHDLAADGRHADGVAVAGDPGRRRPRRSSGCGRRRAVRSGAGPSWRSAGRPSRRCRGGSRRPRWPRPGTARWPTGGCGSRCAGRRRCRRRRRPHRRPRPGRRGRVAPRSGGGAGGCGSTCTSSAPTTSPSTWPARGGSARARGSRRCGRTRRR